jgi:serine phosphatase RsbU (regulator of sigma subunit)
MEEAAKLFARRIVLIHLVVLVVVVAIVYFASREVYARTRDQTMQQAASRQAMLAGQTARGIEAFYLSIFKDLDLLGQAAPEDEFDAPTTAPSGPKMDWRNIFRLDGQGSGPANAAFRTFLAGILWKQLDSRATHLFGVERERLDGAGVVRVRPAPRPGDREPPPDRDRGAIQVMGVSESRLHPRDIVAKSAQWLKSIDKPTISKYQQYELGNGEKIGLNLVCVPTGEKLPRIHVAAVPARIVHRRFLDELNTDSDATSAVLIDDAGTIMATPTASNAGGNIWQLMEERHLGLAKKYIGTGERGSEVLNESHRLGDHTYPPGLFTVEPVSIRGKKWTLMIVSPISEVDALVKRVFKRALFWAIFVICSMTAILVSTSMQLIRSRIRMERVRHDLLTKELTQAREIQLAWLPQQKVSVPTIDIAAVNQPASHISGDFYNWFELPDGRTVVSIGDVTGHGLSAAFLMATTQLLVHGTMLRLEDPGRTLTEVNKQLCMQIFNGQFVTLLICVIDVENGSIEVGTAGHYPPILGSNGTMESLPVEPQLVLGVEKDGHYQTERFDLPPSSSLILYTDGVIDARSPTGQRFDDSGIIESAKGATHSAQSMIDSIIARINSFRGDRELPDDLTLVCIQMQAQASLRESEPLGV